MITGEQLKEIRKSFGLKLREVSRATGFSESAISNIENDTKQPRMDTLEAVANFYGYEIDLSLVQKKKVNKKINFYKPKSAKELLKLSKEDLIEYIFVTQSDEVISRIVNIDINTLKLINLGDLRNILDEHIRKVDNLVVYYKMNNMYSDIETNIADSINPYFIDKLNEKQESKAVNNFLSSIYYIDLGMVYDYENEEWDTYFDDIKVYDKHMNLLGSSYSYSNNTEDNDLIDCIIEEMAVSWRNDNIDNQEVIYALREPLQIRF